MSEVDFEAIGRCEHLRSEFSKILGLRQQAASKISQATRNLDGSYFQERLKKLSIEAIEADLATLKSHEEKLHQLVEEYNKWAEKAGKEKITFY